MKKCYAVILSFLMALFSQHGYAQTRPIVCQTPEANIQSVPLQDFNRYVNKFKAQGKHLKRDLMIIPTVIHVIYRNSADSQQITWARIQSQLTATNKQLRRLNENANETRELFLPVAADCDIQVCLATRKPNRSVFTGVIYHKIPDFDLFRDMASVRAATTLDPERYMNVWIPPGTSLASATFPWLSTAILDGFYIGAEAFGTIGDNLDPDIDQGVTFTHETAHYLGVLHTFDESKSYAELDNRCDFIHDGSIGDFCSDIPLDWEENFLYQPCNDGGRTCDPFDTEPDFFAQTENYMCPGFDICLNMLSKDQRARMRACLTGARHKLSSQGNLNFTGVSCSSSIQRRWPLVSVPNNEAAENETPEKKNVGIFPNPATNIVHLVYNGLPVRDMSIVIYDQVGRKLKEMRSRGAIKEVNVSNLARGIYYVTITIDGVSSTKHFVKADSGQSFLNK